MEYDFVRDPITGYRALLSLEHVIFARWLTEEVNTNQAIIDDLHRIIDNAKQQSQVEYIWQGSEIYLKFYQGEVIASLNNQDELELEAYQDDSLALDQYELSAGCGFEDFTNLFYAWLEFIPNRAS